MNLITRITRTINPRIENYTEETSRRQRDTFLDLQTRHGIKLKRVVKEGSETILICTEDVSIDYRGWISWADLGFHPIEWSPFN